MNIPTFFQYCITFVMVCCFQIAMTIIFDISSWSAELIAIVAFVFLWSQDKDREKMDVTTDQHSRNRRRNDGPS